MIHHVKTHSTAQHPWALKYLKKGFTQKYQMHQCMSFLILIYWIWNGKGAFASQHMHMYVMGFGSNPMCPNLSKLLVSSFPWLAKFSNIDVRKFSAGFQPPLAFQTFSSVMYTSKSSFFFWPFSKEPLGELFKVLLCLYTELLLLDHLIWMLQKWSPDYDTVSVDWGNTITWGVNGVNTTWNYGVIFTRLREDTVRLTSFRSDQNGRIWNL